MKLLLIKFTEKFQSTRQWEMHPFRATSYWVSKQHFSKCWDVFKSHLRISCTSFFVCVYFFFLGRKV